MLSEANPVSTFLDGRDMQKERLQILYAFLTLNVYQNYRKMEGLVNADAKPLIVPNTEVGKTSVGVSL